MSKHTPGPWWWNWDSESIQAKHGYEEVSVLCLAYDANGYAGIEVLNDADAALIAAAPALLDACEAMVKAYPYEDTNQNEPDGLCHCPTCEAYRIGKAAIRMAKGTDND